MINIEYICHASLLINVDNIKILTDPWIKGSCFANCLWLYPPPKKNAAQIGKVDYIYFSHGHEDHFQIESINEVIKKNKNTKVIIPFSKNEWFKRAVKKFGFKNIISLKHNETHNLNKKNSIKLFINDLGEFDSSLLVKSNKDEIFLQTDNIMSIKESKRIGNQHNIFVSFLMPYATGIFPGLYNFKPRLMKKLAKNKENNSLKYVSKIAKNLNSKLNIPYANDLCYLGDLFYLNHLHSFDKKNFIDFLSRKKIKSLIMSPGDKIKIFNRKIVNKKISKLPLNRYEDLSIYSKSIEKIYKEKKYEEINYSKSDFSSALKIFKAKINSIKKNWKFEKFIVRWIFLKNGEEKIVYDQKFNTNRINIPDLKIEINDYRVKNLINKFYPMRFLSFHNGGIKLNRKNTYLTNKEKYYFDQLENLTF